MSTDIKVLVQQLLICSSPGPAKPLVDKLVTILCQITGLDLHPALFLDKDATITAQGKAVSPTTAAQCAEDVERTRVFLQGIYQAITDRQLVNGSQPVKILYAGTGPFGLLVIPLLPLFDPARVQVSLLDIHQDSLDKLQRVIKHLQLEKFIQKICCANACEWTTQERFDVIISETMKQGLVQEPQVSVFAHLQQFLADDGWLIPEQIRLDLWLSHRSRSAAAPAALHLGEIFRLNKITAAQLGREDLSCLSGNLKIPDYPLVLTELKLSTAIQIYQQHQLTENQSQLTLPVYEKNARPAPLSELKFRYQLGSYPQYVFEYSRLPSPSELPLPESLCASNQGIYHLQRLWHKAQKQKANCVLSQELEQEWLLDRAVLDKLGVGLEPAMEQLYFSNNFSQFEDWLLSANGGSISAQVIAAVNQRVIDFVQKRPAQVQLDNSEPVLSAEQLDFWREQGYLIIPGVLNREECQAACAAIWQFLGMREDDRNTWYETSAPMKKIMVQLFRHPSLEVARDKLILKKIFSQLWQRDDLVMSTDRVSFNPPETATWRFPGPHLHWDVKLVPPIPLGTQGMIYLTDTAGNQGAFSCVPGFHKRIDSWLENLPKDVDPGQQDWSRWPVKPIAANAGDLIIWHQALPHGSSPNHAQAPRIVQYINMYA